MCRSPANSNRPCVGRCDLEDVLVGPIVADREHEIDLVTAHPSVRRAALVHPRRLYLEHLRTLDHREAQVLGHADQSLFEFTHALLAQTGMYAAVVPGYRVVLLLDVGSRRAVHPYLQHRNDALHPLAAHRLESDPFF